MGPFINFRPLVAIAHVVLILRRPRCGSCRFERHLMAPTCGRFPPRWELAESAASACTRIRTAPSHPRPTIIRWGRHPRSYPRAKCFPRRYIAIILELGKRSVARPYVSRRIGDARVRRAVTSATEMTVSVVPMWVRANVAVYGRCRREKFRPRPFEFPAVYELCEYQALSRPANTEMGISPHRMDFDRPIILQNWPQIYRKRIINMTKYDGPLIP